MYREIITVWVMRLMSQQLIVQIILYFIFRSINLHIIMLRKIYRMITCLSNDYSYLTFQIKEPFFVFMTYSLQSLVHDQQPTIRNQETIRQHLLELLENLEEIFPRNYMRINICLAWMSCPLVRHTVSCVEISIYAF